MKTINITLKDSEHKKLSEIRDLMKLPNLHETIAQMINVTYSDVSKQ